MPKTPVTDQPVGTLLRDLDDLLDEARRLSEEIRSSLDRQPFWPDRRRVDEPRQPDRRTRHA